MELADEWLSELLLILFLNLSNSEIFLSEIKEDINLCFSTRCSCTGKIDKVDSWANDSHFKDIN